eukprot:TRINITY_DN325_c0_g1_i1.p1 TRINITY_DN325_c0_g1~~TRINITY_DN325_c0_g1_i1.p1  ORF type:complete len:719 (-),score=165.95 TRINITY_DN325_c0_g1_i1:24-2117(-)
MDSSFQAEAVQALAVAIQKRPELFAPLAEFQFKLQTRLNREGSRASEEGSDISGNSMGEEAVWEITEDEAVGASAASSSESNTTQTEEQKAKRSSVIIEQNCWGPQMESEVLDASNSKKELLDFLESKRLTYDFLKFILVEDQAQTRHSEQLFRQDCGISVPLLRELWLKKDGERVIQKLLQPIIARIVAVDRPLEVDPSKIKKGKKSSAALLGKFATKFVKKFVSNFESLLSRESLDLMRFLHLEMSKKFPDVNIGAFVFIRLISPSIVSAETYVPSLGKKVLDPRAQRGIILFTKIIQKIANYSFFNETAEEYMKPINEVIKKLLPQWRSFWSKLLTGKDSSIGDVIQLTEMVDNSLDEIAYNLVSKSALDPSNNNPRCLEQLSQQKVDLKTMFFVETLAFPPSSAILQPSWEFHYRLEPNSTLTYRAKSIIIPSDLEQIYNFMKTIICTRVLDKRTEFSRIVENISENMLVRFWTMKVPFSGKKDLLAQQYHEILPEQGVAVITLRSVEREDVPRVHPRMPIFSGIIIRKVGEKLCKMISVGSIEGRFMKYVPSAVLRPSLKASFSSYEKWMPLLNNIEEEKVVAGNEIKSDLEPEIANQVKSELEPEVANQVKSEPERETKPETENQVQSEIKETKPDSDQLDGLSTSPSRGDKEVTQEGTADEATSEPMAPPTDSATRAITDESPETVTGQV